eukprot:8123726-Pyramimonas_sp.AAC.1
MCSGSSSSRSRSFRSGLGRNGGLDPHHYREQLRHVTPQFSTVQHSTTSAQYIKIDTLSITTWHVPWNVPWRVRGESSWHVARRIPWHVPWH